jgi:hypothetical protein
MAKLVEYLRRQRLASPGYGRPLDSDVSFVLCLALYRSDLFFLPVGVCKMETLARIKRPTCLPSFCHNV